MSEHTGARPFLDTIHALALEPDLGEAMAELVRTVSEHQQAGELVLRVKVKPNAGGMLKVTPELKVKLPEPGRAERSLWASPDGALLTENPAQARLDLRRPNAPSQELRTVNDE